MIAVLRPFDDAVDVMLLRAVHGSIQSICPLAGFIISDTGLDEALSNNGKWPSFGTINVNEQI